MADAVTSQTIFDGEHTYVGKFTNISDGTGESAVTKIDPATLKSNGAGFACSGLKISKIWIMTDGMGLNILWDATSDQLALAVTKDQIHALDFNQFGGIPNNAGTGSTGKIQFTTTEASNGDRYTILLECIKIYAAA